jgi:hypothetical protein
MAPLGGASLAMRVDSANPVREGDHITIRLPLEHLRLFDAAGSRVEARRR